MNERTHTALHVVLAGAGLASAVCAVALIGTAAHGFSTETAAAAPPPTSRQTVVVEVPMPVPYPVVETVKVPVVERVEVPVEHVVTETVTERVEVPTGLTQADVDAEYVTGYEDGRIEGEDWADSTFRADLAAALATPCAVEDDQNCYWIASEAGNGIGSSFVNVRGALYPLPGAD